MTESPTHRPPRWLWWPLAGALLPFFVCEVPLIAWGSAGIEWPVLAASDALDRIWWGVGAASLLLGWPGRGRGIRRATAFLALILATMWAFSAAPTKDTWTYWDERRAQDSSLRTISALHAVGWRQQAPDSVGPLAVPFAAVAHPLGTDEQRRDVLARLLYGLRVSLSVGLLSTALAALIGVLVGAVGGWRGGGWDASVRGAIQIVMCFPVILVLLAVAASRGETAGSDSAGVGILREMLALIVVFGLTRWAGFARLTRHQVQVLGTREWVLAARAQGLRGRLIVWRHVLPHAWPSLRIHAIYGVAQVILLESALSFLGLGFSPPTPSLGAMMAAGREDLGRGVYLVTIAGCALFLVLLIVRRAAQGRDPSRAEIDA